MKTNLNGIIMNGKVYQTEASALTYYCYNYLAVSVRKGSKIHKATERVDRLATSTI